MDKHVRFACSDPVVPKYENLFAELKIEEFDPNFIVTVDIACLLYTSAPVHDNVMDAASEWL